MQKNGTCDPVHCTLYPAEGPLTRIEPCKRLSMNNYKDMKNLTAFTLKLVWNTPFSKRYLALHQHEGASTAV